MIVYAESSAVLAWLLGESVSGTVRRILSQAERVVSSALTATECARAIARRRHDGRFSDQERLAALQLLDIAERNWDIQACSDRVLARARARFPVEPVRTLDAIHLATALLLQEALGPLAMLSYDSKILSNAQALGFDRVG